MQAPRAQCVDRGAGVDLRRAGDHHIRHARRTAALPVARSVVRITGRTGAFVKIADAGSRSSEPVTIANTGCSARPCATRQARDASDTRIAS